MSYSNYPDGMDWGAYDDYHDPELECGHRANDGCDCWCDGGYGDNEASTVIDFSEGEPLIVREGKGSLEIF